MAQLDDPNRFMLVEVYRTPEDAAKHKKHPIIRYGAMPWST